MLLNNIYYLSSILSCLGIAVLFFKINKQNYLYNVLLSFSFIAVFMFLLGIFGYLTLSVITINVLGVSFFIFFFDEIKKYFYANKIYVLQIFLIFFLWWTICNNLLFIKEWDEFFWGQYVKSIFYNQRLYTGGDPVLNLRYQPGFPLLQVFFIYFLEIYNEKFIIFINGCIFLLSIISIFSLQGIIKKIITLCIALLYIFFTDTFLGTLYVEIYLGAIFFCASYYLIFFSHKKNHFYFFLIFIAFLAITKMQGYALSVILCLLLIAKILFYKKNISLFHIFFYFLSVLIPFFLNYLWTIYLNEYGFENFTQIFTYDKIISEIVIDIANADGIIYNFVKYFYTQNLANNKLSQLLGEFTNFLPSFVLTFFIFFFINLFLIFKSKNFNTEKRILVILFFISIFIYVLIPYIFELDYQKGGDKSFSPAFRYMKVYFLSIFLMTLFLISKNTSSLILKYLLTSCFLLSVVFLIYFQQKILYFYNQVSIRIEKQKEFRREHVQTTLILKKYLDKHSRLMHIYYGSDGYESMSFRYHISPYLSDNFNFSVGPKKNSQDLWSADYSVEELITYLNSDDLYVERRKFFEKRSIDPSFLLLKKNYTHIYVENAHYNFYEKFKKVFINFDEINKKNKNFFLIIRENNLLYLKLLDNIK
jgi:hypothetical protein